MASISDVYVTVLPETSKVADGIKRAFREVDPEARRAGDRWGKEIEQGIGKPKVELQADTAKARAEIDAAARDRRSTIHLDVDQSQMGEFEASLSRSMASAGSSAGGSLSSGFSSVLSAGGPVGGSVLAGLVLPLTAGLIDLAGVAATTAQSVLLLPGALGAAAVGFGTLKLATAGFADAIGDIKDPKKFAEDLKGLSPAAQQAALSIQAMMPAFDNLKNATQDAFFQGVGGMLNGLVNTYLPTIQQATTGIAGAFNNMLGGLSTQLMTPSTQLAIQSFLTNVTQAFQNLAPAIAPLTKAFADIASVGSGFLPEIASAATNAATAFSDFITQAKGSGDLKKWMGEGLDAIKQLGSIAWDVGRAFMALAPAGQDILPKIVTAFQWLADEAPKAADFAVKYGQFLGDGFRGAKFYLDAFITGFHALESVASSVGNTITAVMNRIRGDIDNALQPIRAAIDLANQLPGVHITNIPALGDKQGTTLSSPGRQIGSSATGGLGIPGGGGGRQVIPTPAATTNPWFTGAVAPPAASPLPTAGLPGIPSSGYAVPLPPPTKTKGSTTPNLPYTGTADPYAMYSGGYTSDAALLANVPAGSYSQTSSADLTKGLGDCSSAVEDLVNLMQGNSTAGRSMSTGNAPEWLAAHGFVPGSAPGAFNVGFNNEHMQATLPGGTPFNWGSNAAAARGGVGGTGAFDPAFTQHYYLPVSGNPASSAAGGGMTGSDLSLRNAQQRINDTQHTEEQAQGRLNELRAKGTATDRQMEAAEYALAKAKREHQDAIDGLTVAQDKYNKSATQGQGANSAAQDLGSSFLGGIGQIFGLDGSLFQDPSQFGLFKIFKAAMGLKFDPSKAAPGGGQGTNYGAGLPSSGGGGGGLGGLLSNIPKAFGALQVGSPQAGPGGYMPGMPGGAGNGSLLDAVQFSPTGQPGSPGPGNNPVGYQNAGIDLRGASFGDSQGQLSNQISAINSSQNRYGPMLQNVPG